jgi:hypothetical protein
MVAEDFLGDPQVRQWLDGIEPAWMLLTFDSLRALRQKPSAVHTAIRIANDLSAADIASSAVARSTVVLLRQAIERGGVPLTATGNLSRAVVAEMSKLIEWPDYDQAAMFQFSKVINEPDFLPLHVVRILLRQQHWYARSAGSWWRPRWEIDVGCHAARHLSAILFILLWRMDLQFGRWLPLMATGRHRHRTVVVGPAGDWQSSEKLTRLCTIPAGDVFDDLDRRPTGSQILRPLLWFGLLEHSSEKKTTAGSASIIFTARRPCSIEC